MIGLVIFTQIALVGCAFLIYFMFALLRDSRIAERDKEIRKVPNKSKKVKMLHLLNLKELRPVQKKRL